MQYAMFILYVADQARSREFYMQVLGLKPVLDVPGMTEFKLTDTTVLGLMPNEGIAQILGDATPHPREGTGVPRAELYLPVKNVDEAYARLLRAGGTPVSAPAPRNWGDTVAYGADPDGHIIALATTQSIVPD